MILTIIFVLVLLIGISLFIAVVGTSLLRRNSRYVERSSLSASGRAVYREQPGERSAPPPHGYTPIEPASFGPPPYEARDFEPGPYPVPRTRSSSAEGRWFALSIVVLIVMFFAVFFGVRVYQSATSKPKIDFCEYVDFARMKPVNASDMFTRGNVTLLLRSRAPLEIEKMRIEVYRIDREGLVPYLSQEMKLKPEWLSFKVTLLFEQIGSYSVMIYTNAGALLGQKTIVIVPDSYAYTPVLG